jgi:transposase
MEPAGNGFWVSPRQPVQSGVEICTLMLMLLRAKKRLSAVRVRLPSNGSGLTRGGRSSIVEQVRHSAADPTGYVIYWQLAALGVPCAVVAPTLVPTKAGDRVKTDRRDAAKLARSFRAGDLTAVWVPDAAHEALRDLVRAREAAKKDQLRAPSARQISAAPRTAAGDEDDGVDPAAPGVDPPGAVRAPGPGGHAAGLSARSRSRGRAHQTARARDR